MTLIEVGLTFTAFNEGDASPKELSGRCMLRADSIADVGLRVASQRSSIAVAAVSGSHAQLCEVLDSVERFVAAAAGVELLDVETAWLESDL